MKTYTSILFLLASSKAAYGHSASSLSFEFTSKSAKIASSKSAKISISKSAKTATKGAKSLEEPIRRILVQEIQRRTLHSSSKSKSKKEDSSSMSFEFSSAKSAKRAKTSVIFSGKGGKIESDKSRRFLHADDAEVTRRFLDSGDSMSMSMELTSKILKSKDSKSGKSTKSGKSLAKSADKKDLSDDADESIDDLKSKSSKAEEIPSSSSAEDDDIDDMASKSSKDAKSAKASVLRFIEPSSTAASEPLKASSSVEYSDAQAPESATDLSKESSGAMSYGLVASFFGVVALVTTSAVLY